MSELHYYIILLLTVLRATILQINLDSCLFTYQSCQYIPSRNLEKHRFFWFSLWGNSLSWNQIFALKRKKTHKYTNKQFSILCWHLYWGLALSLRQLLSVQFPRLLLGKWINILLYKWPQIFWTSTSIMKTIQCNSSSLSRCFWLHTPISLTSYFISPNWLT